MATLQSVVILDLPLFLCLAGYPASGLIITYWSDVFICILPVDIVDFFRYGKKGKKRGTHT
jgi:hypothetical protein